MVDFRYHIVSIVAVFLALGIGLLMGSGVLGDPLLENIRDRARDVQDFNEQLKDDVDELNEELTVARHFAEAVEPLLVAERLAGDELVFLDISAGGAPLGSLVEMVEDRAGGTVAAIVTVRERFTRAAAEDYEDLRAIMGLPLADADELRQESALELGSRIAALAAERGSGQPQRSVALLGQLEEAGFLDVAEEDEATPVPAGATFVLVASGSSDPEVSMGDVAVSFAEGLARERVAVVAVEAAESEWDVASVIRGDGDLSDAIATVDNVDTLSGRIALVMALDRVQSDEIGHYGEKGGASGGVIPEPGPQG
ncbi:MAG: copper transporter [Actinomycetota bacterium]|nr:copper transporter [Actinomycetota bacterium]